MSTLNEQFVAHVAGLDARATASLYPEELALCLAWYDGHNHNPALQARYDGVRRTLRHWLGNPLTPDTDTEGNRQQPLLRQLMEVLLAGRLVELRRDEIDFLVIAWDLMEKCTDAERFARPITLLAPHLKALQARRAALPPARGIPSLATRILVVHADSFAGLPPSETPGILGDARIHSGPLLQHPGDIKIFGNLPKGVTLFVSGACYVNGRVEGTIQAQQDCEVRRDIAGTVECARGALRLRNLLRGARAAALLNEVRFRAAQSPILVFSGRSLWCGQSIAGGRCFAPRIHCLDEIKGAQIEVTQELRAAHFANMTTKTTSIRFRDALHPADHGGEKPNRQQLARIAESRELNARLHAAQGTDDDAAARLCDLVAALRREGILISDAGLAAPFAPVAQGRFDGNIHLHDEHGHRVTTPAGKNTCTRYRATPDAILAEACD